MDSYDELKKKIRDSIIEYENQTGELIHSVDITFDDHKWEYKEITPVIGQPDPG